MQAKTQAILGATCTAVFGFLSWLVTVPPDQQTGMLGQFIALFPAPWQPGIGFWARAFSSVSAIYMVYHASRSGRPGLNE